MQHLVNALAPSSETSLPSKHRTVRVVSAVCALPNGWRPHRRPGAVHALDREDVARCDRLAQCLGALFGYLVAFKHKSVRVLFDSSALSSGQVFTVLTDTLLSFDSSHHPVAVQAEDRENGVAAPCPMPWRPHRSHVAHPASDWASSSLDFSMAQLVAR